MVNSADGGEIVGFINDLANFDHENPSHYVKIAITNNTDIEWERCTYELDGHIWKCEGIINGEPPLRIKPGQWFHSTAVCNTAGKGATDIVFMVAYQRIDQTGNIIWVRVFCPLVGSNDYGDTGLQKVGRDLGFKCEERGNFRSVTRGNASLMCGAFFTVSK